MIITKKHMVLIGAVITATISVFVLISQTQNSQVFSDSDFRVVLDAGHGA